MDFTCVFIRLLSALTNLAEINNIYLKITSSFNDVSYISSHHGAIARSGLLAVPLLVIFFHIISSY